MVGNVFVEQANRIELNTAYFEVGLNTTASGINSTALGRNTFASGDFATALGHFTTASGLYSPALGQNTKAKGSYSTAMGHSTTASGDTSTALGYSTTASGDYSMTSGFGTTASGDYSFAAGRSAQATNQGTFVWADSQVASFNSTSNNQFLIRAAGGVGINTNSPASTLHVNGTVTASVLKSLADVVGNRLAVGANSFVLESDATIAGGQGNTNGGTASVISGGTSNRIGGGFCRGHTIGGGGGNVILGYSGFSTIAGGSSNLIDSTILPLEFNTFGSAIGGGRANAIARGASNAAISGGMSNRIGSLSTNATICGGYGNLIHDNGFSATIPGGRLNSASNYAFAAGNQAKAVHTGAFVWGDSTDADIASTNANSVTMRASGGYRLFTDTNATTGAFLAAGSGSWTSMSDRNAKDNLRAADSREVLEKVVALPVQTWNYRSQDAGIRHIGPMAQDFKAAFGVGESDTGIATVDADGVALAAIQGLNEKVEVSGQKSEIRIQKLEVENAELKRRLAELERAVQQLGIEKAQP